MRKLAATSALVMAGSMASGTGASAEPPGLIPVQGFLSDANGDPLTGARTLAFALYATENAGTALFTESFSINTPTGAFSVVLGSTRPIEAATIPEDGSLWLGLSVDGASELSPRLRFGSAPYAVRSRFADEASTLQGQSASDFVMKSGDTINGDLLVSSETEGDGVVAPLRVEDANFNDELLIDSDEIDSTSVLGLRININSRGQTRVGSNLIGGAARDFEDDELILTRVVAQIGQTNTVQSITTETMESYCGDFDGCRVVIVETGFDAARPELRRSAGPILIMYEEATGRWSVGDGTVAGVQNTSAREVMVDAGGCTLEDDIPLSGGGQADFGFLNISASDCSFSLED